MVPIRVIDQEPGMGTVPKELVGDGGALPVIQPPQELAEWWRHFLM